jgi:(1->4)-alpha-D-glucan 1-alpha-D-glucosylmutase
MSILRVPSATYRVQFSLGFRFVDARDLVPYCHELGITDFYGSPRLKARRGSSHGYDVADPSRVNSELGTEDEYEELVVKRKHYGMGLLLDIVPNHMSASADNPWWMDVLENGPSSPYASFFDIDWHPETTKAAFLQENKILLPILGDLYGNVLEDQQFILKVDETGFFIRYEDARLPLDPKTYKPILEHFLDILEKSVGAEDPALGEVANLLAQIDRLPSRNDTDPINAAERQKLVVPLKSQLWATCHGRSEIRRCLERTLDDFNGVRGNPRSFDRLDQLLSDQAYRVAFWKLAAEEINYRRFFDVSDLVGLRVEDPNVFEARHALLFQLFHEGKISGLRIDHVDGLRDPLAYLQELQARLGSTSRGLPEPGRAYVVVEKILAREESLPAEWPVFGTTGYDFLNSLNALFVSSEGLRSLGEIYRRFSGISADFHEFAYQGNKRVLQELFAGEVKTLAHELGRLAAEDRRARDVPLSEYFEALREVTACLPVYRTYIRDLEISPQDRKYIEQALQEAQRRAPEDRAGPPAFEFLRRVLLLDPPEDGEGKRHEWLRFVMGWQQFTGAAMAKGLEDMALYNYNRLVSLNEVGGNPGTAGTTVEDFHTALRARRERMPYTLNATSTHDTKRSEDVRARLNVLSELTPEWAKHLEKWSRWNRAKKQVVNGVPAPDRNDEIFLYQNLLGVWPLCEADLATLPERLEQYVLKAAREAKTHTSWLRPDAAYEAALVSFTRGLVETSEKNRFLRSFRPFQKVVAYHGALNSIAQVLVKIAAPGVPDFYQGSEVWDFSLVDPDNRRPVDFRLLIRLFEELRRQESRGLLPLVHDLLSAWEDGRIKLYVTYKGLNFRKTHKELFLDGEYIPLPAAGSHREHVCAFARHHKKSWALVAVPRLTANLVSPGQAPLGRRVWGSTVLDLPRNAPRHWINIFTGESVEATLKNRRKTLTVSVAFHSFPLALLTPRSGHLRPKF